MHNCSSNSIVVTFFGHVCFRSRKSAPVFDSENRSRPRVSSAKETASDTSLAYSPIYFILSSIRVANIKWVYNFYTMATLEASFILGPKCLTYFSAKLSETIRHWSKNVRHFGIKHIMLNCRHSFSMGNHTQMMNTQAR